MLRCVFEHYRGQMLSDCRCALRLWLNRATFSLPYVSKYDAGRDRSGMTQDQCMDPAAVAKICLHLIAQVRSAWIHELDISADAEKF